MTFAKNLSRGIAFGALAVGLTLTSVAAQNGTNYHVLTNDSDVLYIGVGAGGAATAQDGLGTWMPGEDMRGSHKVAFSSDFGYRNPQFRENMCVLTFSPGTGKIGFPGLVFFEFDGMNGNRPAVFSKPFCTPGAASAFFSSAGIPYGGGNPAYTSPSAFLLSPVGPGLGIPSSTVIVLPNEGLQPAGGGTATPIGAAGTNLPIASTGFCWGVQFTWNPSALPFTDDIDGMWHYNVNSNGETSIGSGVINQYWSMSNDELNLWQSYTVGSTASATGVIGFLPNTDYHLVMSSVSPNTYAALAPQGMSQSGPYYTQTENVGFNPNGGFDVGQGSHAVSMSGLKGVLNPATGLGNQDPAGPPGVGAGPFVPTLGFMTWDNGGDLDGSVRLPWITIDTFGLAGLDPGLAPDFVIPAFGVRPPAASATDVGFGGLPNSLFGLYLHTTAAATSGWPDPGGFPSGTFGIPAIGGASLQLPLPVLPVVCTGSPFILTYGSSGLLGPAGPLTWDETKADISIAKELVMFD